MDEQNEISTCFRRFNVAVSGLSLSIHSGGILSNHACRLDTDTVCVSSIGQKLITVLLCDKVRILFEADWRIDESVFYTTFGSDYGLSPVRRQVIIWTNNGLLPIWPLGTNFDILIEITTFFITENAFEDVVCNESAILSRPRPVCWFVWTVYAWGSSY